MPEYLSPGVYVEESSGGPRPIEGVGTTTAAFIGFAPGGPANTPVFVANWQQYVETFGSLRPDGSRDPHMPGTYLSHAVYGYFNNGGTRCWVEFGEDPEEPYVLVRDAQGTSVRMDTRRLALHVQAEGDVTVEAGGRLVLRGREVTVEGRGDVTVRGATIRLN
ncbi:hypothetical protein [Deinococcus pimensis]|uniref:hypothetical protein n=1 Tax=Deinococcus pimensis TaxID=309888 RepID=UPI0004841560|nr:hypothetical protein [Deinococcus pimensis]